MTVRASISKLEDIDRSDMTTNVVITKVIDNFNKIEDQVFGYCFNLFTKESYVRNLYVYNLLIEAFRVNMILLKKVYNSKEKS
jgi:predicted methyltransferase